MINVPQLHPPQLILITTCKHACQTPHTFDSSSYGHSPVISCPERLTLKIILKKTDLRTNRIYTPVSYPFVSSSRLPHMNFFKKRGENVLKKRPSVFLWNSWARICRWLIVRELFLLQTDLHITPRHRPPQRPDTIG